MASPTPDAAAFDTPDADPSSPDAGDDPDPLASQSDSFDGTSIDGSWSRFQPELVDMEVAGGVLTMATNQYAQWYNRSQGPLLYKTIGGNFKVTSRVRARRRSNPSLPPNQLVHLGGVMARAPYVEDEPPNYVFIVVGNDVDDLSVETKTTVDGDSAFTGPSWGSGDAELRICRIDETFYMLKRPVDGGEWDVAESFDRPDLPAMLEVGTIAYSPSGDPDLVVTFEEVTFASVTDKTDCVQ